jgi:hypothetical protein
MNEYGFYFGVPYAMTMEGMTVGFTFNEDGSVIFSSPEGAEEIPAGVIIYGDHSIDMTAMDGPVFGVSPDGTQIAADGIILSVGSSSTPPKGTVYLPNTSLIEGDLVLPTDGRATSIPANTFEDQISLTGIIVPESITTIGEGAFCNCDSLTSIEVSENHQYYKSMDGNLYSKDGKTLIQYAIGKKDTSVEISNSVTSIAGYAFAYCDSLTSIVIPDSVTSIGDYAFKDCNITTATIPALAISSILAGSLTTVVITSGTSIANHAFTYRVRLTSVVIPDSVTSIGDYAFYRCESLTSVVIPDSVTTIGNYAFSECKSLPSITIPGSVTHIGFNTFKECTSLTNIHMLDGITTINTQAFYNCTSLTSVVIPDSVTAIDNDAFNKCTSLTSIEIPASVTSIRNGAFKDCTKLAEIVFKGTITQWNNIDKNTTSHNAWNYNVPATYVQCTDGQVALK